MYLEKLRKQENKMTILVLIEYAIAAAVIGWFGSNEMLTGCIAVTIVWILFDLWFEGDTKKRTPLYAVARVTQLICIATGVILYSYGFSGKVVYNIPLVVIAVVSTWYIQSSLDKKGRD